MSSSPPGRSRSTSWNRHARRFVASLTFLLLWPALASAAIFQVNVTIFDAPDDDVNDGECRISGGDFCTLRAAVMQANATPGTDVITLPADATIVLDIQGNPKFLPASAGDLNVTESLIILHGSTNPDSFPVIDATALDDRVFNVFQGDFSLARVRITGGSRDEADGKGGAIYVGALASSVTLTEVDLFANTAYEGGAIYVERSELSVVDSIIHGNGTVEHGGALVNHCGSVTLERTSVYQNSNFGADGEALYNFRNNASDSGECRLNLRNSSVLESSGLGVLSQGGMLDLTSSTVAENHGGGIRVTPDLGVQTLGELRMRNSVIADHGPSNCQLVGTGWNTNGYNASDDGSCDLDTGSTNIVASNLGLLAAANDSESWQRFKRLGPDSPLLDAGHPVTGGIGCPEEDQRDKPRPRQGSVDGPERCDIGSIEMQSIQSDVIFADGFDPAL